MKTRVEKFRTGVEKLRAQNPGKRKRYSNELKLMAVEILTDRIASGASISACAKELGLPDMTLRKWMELDCGAFRKVRVAGEIQPAEKGSIALVTPQGFRVEGLDIKGAASLLRALA